jgi:hypothetical protein
VSAFLGWLLGIVLILLLFVAWCLVTGAVVALLTLIGFSLGLAVVVVLACSAVGAVVLWERFER